MDTATTSPTPTDPAPTRSAEVHERTYTWTDPDQAVASVGRTTGLEFLRAIGDGRLPRPPITDTLGIEPVEAEHGRVVFGLTPAAWHYNPLGLVHGGVLAAVLDTAAGCAVHSALPAGTGYTSMDLATRFVRPVTVASGPLRCEGRILSLGRRAAVAEARVEDAHGRLVAHATSTCLLLPLDDQPAG